MTKKQKQSHAEKLLRLIVAMQGKCEMRIAANCAEECPIHQIGKDCPPERKDGETYGEVRVRLAKQELEAYRKLEWLEKLN